MRKNTFNRKQPVTIDCANHPANDKPHSGEFSYMPIIKWSDFINNINKYLDQAYKINEDISSYNICKTVD